MTKKLIIILLLFFLACSENPSGTRGEDFPQIEDVKISKFWNLGNTTKLRPVELILSEYSTVNDSTVVSFNVENNMGNVIYSGSLFDNGGINGSTDIIARDGIFRNIFQALDITSVEGMYSFNFSILDLSYSADSIFFIFNEPPIINNISSPDSFLSGVPSQTIFVSISDPDEDFQNDSVMMDIRYQGYSILIEPYRLANDGDLELTGDITAGDSIYSFKIDSSFSIGKHGNYTLEIFAKDQFEEKTEKISRDLFLQNLGPNIINVNMPGIVEKPAQIPINVLVNDPQGNADITRVYFELKRSDGTYIKESDDTHRQVELFDDGNQNRVDHGDVLAGDGIYSEIIVVDEGNPTDIFTFEFYAIDKVGNISPISQQDIEIRERSEL